LALGRYDDAIKLCERAAGLESNVYTMHLYSTAAYAEKGEMTKAAAARGELEKRLPGYTISILKSKGYSSQPLRSQPGDAVPVP